MKLQKYLSLHSSGVLKPSWDRTIELFTELHEGQETALFFPPLTALTFSGSFPKLSTQQMMRCAVPFSVVLWLSVLGANYLNVQKQSFQPRTTDAPNCKIFGREGDFSFCRVRFLLPASEKTHWNSFKVFFWPLISSLFYLCFDHFEKSDRYLTSREMLGGRWQASKLQWVPEDFGRYWTHGKCGTWGTWRWKGKHRMDGEL